MTHEFLLWSFAGASLATGLVTGIFLAFSDFVMRSLKVAAPAAGAEAINR